MTAVGALAAVLASASCGRNMANSAAAGPAPVITVAVIQVRRADLKENLRIAAEFRPFQEIEVHAKVAGYVQRINVDVGDRVKQGQTLAVLEAPELEQELKQADAATRGSKEEVSHARYDLRRADADYTVAHLAYTRLDNVNKTNSNLVAQQEVDEAYGHDSATEAQEAGAKAALAAARERNTAAEANYQRVQALLAYTRITAPFDGVVTRRYADTGAMLAAGTSSEQQALPLVKLSQNGLLRLDIPVPEANVPVVRQGLKVEVEVAALRRTFEGTVARFADRLDDSTRTMMTEIDVPNPKLEIVPGMYAYVAFPVMTTHNTLTLPIQAVSRSGDKAVAYRVNREGRIEILPVTVGTETQSQIEIVSGLAEGDRVVVGNTSQLRQGESVTPKVVDLTGLEGQN